MKRDSQSRLKFGRLILSNLSESNSQTWGKICADIAVSNNELLNTQAICFRYLGVVYPPPYRVLRADTRLTVPELHPALVEEFKVYEQKFVKDFRLFYNEFTNALAKFCRHATSTDCFHDVFSSLILNPVIKEDIDYLPAAYAKGWKDYSKQDFIDEHKRIIEQADYYLTARKLI